MSELTAPVPASVESATPARVVLSSYIPEFDGLRGTAILAVMATHSVPLRMLGLRPLVEYGRLGVDLFFVLSGFLITGILLESRGSAGYFRNFYARRALRIWPLYYLVLCIFLLVLPLLSGASEIASMVPYWPYLALYVQNCLPHLYLSEPLSPTWSLAIEEQFYMAWPLLVRGVRGIFLPVLLLGVVLASLGTRLALFHMNLPMNFIHRFTGCRLESIALGSLMGWWVRSPGCTAKLWRSVSLGLMPAGLAGLLLTRLVWGTQSTVVSYLFVAVFFAGLLGVALVSGEGQWIGRILRWRWLRYVGRISYGLYLLHMPAYFAVQSFAENHPRFLWSSRAGLAAAGILGFGSAFAIAAVSWRFFESPLLRLKRFFPSTKSPT